MSLLNSLKNEKDVHYVLDSRLLLPDYWEAWDRTVRVSRTLNSRFKIELQLRKLLLPDTIVLCMGNLPPLLAKGRFIVFIQNRYLVDNISLRTLPSLIKLRIRIERWWLHIRAGHVSRFIVQTQTMNNLVKKSIGLNSEIVPLFPVEHRTNKIFKRNILYDFIYIATGEPHKNHLNLIKAWIIIAGMGRYPSLCLTLDRNRFRKLCTWIDHMCNKHNLNIKILGELPHKLLMEKYRETGAMIYPAFFESFGMTLLEAAENDLPIAAADKDYVHDVIEPTILFDPASPESIAKAVLNISLKPALSKIQTVSPEEFLSNTFTY
jgi:glycosyltransferase involved in cell wall biosynthesis